MLAHLLEPRWLTSLCANGHISDGGLNSSGVMQWVSSVVYPVMLGSDTHKAYSTILNHTRIRKQGNLFLLLNLCGASCNFRLSGSVNVGFCDGRVFLALAKTANGQKWNTNKAFCRREWSAEPTQASSPISLCWSFSAFVECALKRNQMSAV